MTRRLLAAGRRALRYRFRLIQITVHPSYAGPAQRVVPAKEQRQVISHHWTRFGARTAHTTANEHYNTRVLPHHAAKGTPAPDLVYLIEPIG